jgi:hypothetical protein
MSVRTVPDQRRDAANLRLRRLKRAIAATTAVLGLTIWSLIAGSVAADAANATVTDSSSAITSPGDSFFQPGSPSLGSGTSQPPVLRTGGS